MTFDPTAASAGEIAAAVRDGETSAAAVLEATLTVIRKRDPVLNAFTAITDERAARGQRRSTRIARKAARSDRWRACRSR